MKVSRHIVPIVASCLVSALCVPIAHAQAPLTSASRLSWTPLSALPEARSRPAVTVGHDGNIYAFGGFVGTNGAFRVTNTTFVYDMHSHVWSQSATMPIAVEGAAAVTLPDGRMAVLGGGVGCFNTQNCTIYQSVQLYNPKTHSWCLLAPMQTRRYRFGATLGPDGRMYAVGGWDGHAALASVEAYDPRKGAWSFVTDLPQAEEGLSVVVTHHRVVAIGGFDGGTTFYNDLFVYNGRTWKSGSPMLIPRADFGAAIDTTGQIYAFGGYTPGAGYLTAVELYDPASDKWSSAPALPRPVATLGAAVAQGRIYAIGGSNGEPTAQVMMLGSPGTTSNPFAN